MSDIPPEKWLKETRDVRAKIRERFPDFRCVRCENDNFLMRIWRDTSLQLAFGDDRIVEYICDSCGLMERYAVAGLSGDLNNVRQRIKAKNG